MSSKSKKIPSNIAKDLKKRVFALCDEFDYCARNRIDNAEFMNKLAASPDVGGIIRNFVPQEKVRTYIKDALLNAYAKKHIRDKANSVDIKKELERIYKPEFIEVLKKDKLSVWKSDDKSDSVYVVQYGTLLKWETALRKALEYVASTEHIKKLDLHAKICLALVIQTDELTEGDKKHIRAALDLIDVKVLFIE